MLCRDERAWPRVCLEVSYTGSVHSAGAAPEHVAPEPATVCRLLDCCSSMVAGHCRGIPPATLHIKHYIIRKLCVYSVLCSALYANSLLFRIS